DDEQDDAERDIEAGVEELLAAPARSTDARHRLRRELRRRRRRRTLLKEPFQRARRLERRRAVRARLEVRVDAPVRRSLAGGDSFQGVEALVAEHTLARAT